MDLLAYLARHAGEIISEKRLVQALARRYSHDPEA
jgi:DNA-binding winged helix-turn-helix (wHTH) protein